jgi:nucleotide-binding universal stress UspA family protein
VYRSILVGCDGSEEQADALALAQQLRDPDGGRLLLANVIPLMGALTGPGLVLEYGQWLAERADETLAGAAAQVDPGVPHEPHTLASPSAAAGLNDLAEELEADLIVLGRTERGMAADLAGRMTIQRLLHGAPCAVAVAAPDQASRFGASPRLCVAYDGSPEADFALQTAYGIAAATSASVLVCTVFEPIVAVAGFAGVIDDEEIERHLRAALDAAAARAPAGTPVEPRLLRGSPPYAILRDAMAGADLIVTGSRGYGPLHRALAGSTSALLLKDARTSVLVTPRVVAARPRVSR